jgi:hypothetical protein
MMWRRLLLLDLALAVVLVAGVLRVEKSWNEFDATHRLEAVKPEKEPARTLPVTTASAGTPEDWMDIAVKDPFSFDRNDVPIVAPKQELALKPKPVLYGVMSVGSEWIAMMGPAQSGTRGSRPVRVGESMDNWQIVEIQSKSVIVTAANGTRETVIMNDPTAQVARSSDRTMIAGPTSAPVVPVASPQPTATNNPQTQPPNQPGMAPTPAPAEDEYLVTPFGKVRRTKP